MKNSLISTILETSTAETQTSKKTAKADKTLLQKYTVDHG